MCDFDSSAKKWDENPIHAKRSAAIAKAISAKSRFKKGAKALEYGCGTGILSFLLREELGEIVLADCSQGMIDVLAEKIGRAGAADMKALLLDLMKSPAPRGRFGVVYTQMALHHIRDTLGILRKFHEILEEGAPLFVADLDKEDGSFHAAHPDFDGHNGFDRDALGELAREAGFREIEFETVYQLEKEVDGATRSYPVFLMSAKA
jgi:ubiquinone/menaquinone biosynthesis C-methylase UbiE